jgi:hypothetical protein
LPSPPSIAIVQTITSPISISDIEISFEAPEDNGSPITGYEIEIKKADGDYFASLECIASRVDQDTTRLCYVSFTELRASPYWLTFDTLVEVRVRATNSIGTGAYSQTNTQGT